MSRILAIGSILEALTGCALFIDPSIVTQLLLGSEVNGVATVIARVAGAALMSLGLACWPGVLFDNRRGKGLMALLLYGILITFYLGYVGVAGEFRGPLLFPAVAVHAALTCLLIFQANASCQT